MERREERRGIKDIKREKGRRMKKSEGGRDGREKIKMGEERKEDRYKRKK